jgi:thioredoxin 1
MLKPKAWTLSGGWAMAGGPVEITKENIQSTIESGGTVVLDFWAPWCGPCRAFAPTFEAAAGANPDITFGKVNTDEEQELASAFEIKSIPTLMVFRDKVLLFSQAGALPKAALDDLISQVKNLDMKRVHQEIAARREEPTAKA